MKTPLRRHVQLVPMAHVRSAAWELALCYAGLIVYASLYPFVPWSSNGLPWWGFVSYPWPRYWSLFDILANLLGYLPFGFLSVLAVFRNRDKWPLHKAVLFGFAASALLSFSVEALQNWLPQRVPSNVDWLLNSLGGVLGAFLAWVMGQAGVLGAWSRLRQYWFVHDAQEGLVLLLLWPWALLYPLPVPFGLGQVLERVGKWLPQWLAGTPFIQWLPERNITVEPISTWQEIVVVAFGIWLPCLLAFGIMPSKRKRVVIAAGMFSMGMLVTALGNTLGFGPQYAWAWLWRPVQMGLILGAILIAISILLPQGLCRFLTIAALIVQLFLVNGASVSAYFNWGLEEWLPGRFIRFYGLTQWIGWVWPYAALVYAIARLVSVFRRRSPANPT